MAEALLKVKLCLERRHAALHFAAAKSGHFVRSQEMLVLGQRMRPGSTSPAHLESAPVQARRGSDVLNSDLVLVLSQSRSTGKARGPDGVWTVPRSSWFHPDVNSILEQHGNQRGGSPSRTNRWCAAARPHGLVGMPRSQNTACWSSTGTFTDLAPVRSSAAAPTLG